MTESIDWAHLESAANVQARALADHQAFGQAMAMKAIEAVYGVYISHYPEAERATWPKQEDAARAVIAGTATTGQTALLTARATLSGETVADLAAKIITASDTFSQLGLALAGIRSAVQKAIEEATDVAAVDTALTAMNIQLAALSAA